MNQREWKLPEARFWLVIYER